MGPEPPGAGRPEATTGRRPWSVLAAPARRRALLDPVASGRPDTSVDAVASEATGSAASRTPDQLRDAAVARFATQLLIRWGVLFRDLVARETLAPSWRELRGALRRMEARGEIRGGRFVAGFVGEQFARPEAVDLLRRVRRDESAHAPLAVPAADPLNLTGIVLPGPRVSALSGDLVALLPSRDPVEAAHDPGVARRGGTAGPVSARPRRVAHSA